MGTLSKGIPVPVVPVSGGCSLGNEAHNDQSHDIGCPMTARHKLRAQGYSHATTDSAPAQATQGKIPRVRENQTSTPPS
jgi:hypothetical protein